MLHRCQVILNRGFGNVANEEIVHPVAIRKERRFTVFRVFTHHGATFVLSPTNVKQIRVFTHRT